MDDATKSILEDLKITFGPKRILTPADVGHIIGKSPEVLANLRNKNKSPLPPVRIGGSIGYSIYHLAELLAHGKVKSAALPEEAIQQQQTPSQYPPPKRKHGKKGLYDHLLQWQQAATMRLETANLELELIKELGLNLGCILGPTPPRGNDDENY